MNRKPKYKQGDVLRSKVNGAEIVIHKVGNGNYEYRDPKTKRIFVTNYQTLERCVKEKENEKI